MAIGKVVVNVVDVGQGQCTFVEVYDDTATLIHTLLFDCGSDKQSANTQTNLRYIADTVSAMAVPTFDLVVFSHSDTDHISLMYDLLQKCSKKPRIKEVHYGGLRANYTKHGFNILNCLVTQNYCNKEDVEKFLTNDTDYSSVLGEYNYVLWKSNTGVNDVKVRLIAANVLSSDPDWDSDDGDFETKTAEAKNRVSAVCGLYFVGASYVICGDATNITMAAIGNYFKGTTVFDNNRMITLPHHGSRATGLAVASGKEANETAVGVVRTFAALMKSHLLTASAYEKHRHPSLELIRYFIPYTEQVPFLQDSRLKEKKAHRVSVNIDLNLQYANATKIAQTYWSFDTPSALFTTRYCDAGPYLSFTIGSGSNIVKASDGVNSPLNSFASWVFTTAANGSNTLSGYDNLGGTSFTAPASSALSDAFAPEFVREARGGGLRPQVRSHRMGYREIPGCLKTFR